MNAVEVLSFVALRPEEVVEVRYDHMEGDRSRLPERRCHRVTPDTFRERLLAVHGPFAEVGIRVVTFAAR